jgi:TolA-binding protein
MKTFDFSHFIEKYLAGEMSVSERIWFEKELNGNVELLNEVNLRKNTDKILEDHKIISLRNKLSMIEKGRSADIRFEKKEGIQFRSKTGIQFDKKEDIQYSKSAGIQFRKLKMPFNLKYAAVIAGIVLIGSITIFSGKNLSNDEIVNRYFKVYEAPAAQRSGQPLTSDDFSQALELYNTHDYQKAAILFSKVVERNPRDMQSELLSGVSNFEGKKYPEAKQSFVNVINDNDNLFIETAKWYLALCYVQTDEKKKALQLFEMIKKEDGIYSNDAKKIIRKLN